MSLTIGSDGNVYDDAGNLRTDLFAQDGCIYDTDSNRLSCPGGIIPLPGAPSVDLPQRPTVITLPNGQTAAQYMDSQGQMQYILVGPSPNYGTPPDNSNKNLSWWDQLKHWLGQPVLAGGTLSNGAAIGLTAAAAVFLRMSQHSPAPQRGRRR